MLSARESALSRAVPRLDQPSAIAVGNRLTQVTFGPIPRGEIEVEQRERRLGGTRGGTLQEDTGYERSYGGE